MNSPSKKTLSAVGIPTRIFRAKENLFDFIIEQLETHQISLQENSILAITSKIFSLSENQILVRNEVKSKLDLVTKEAEQVLGTYQYGTCLTIKHGILMPAAGIDESNSESQSYLLLPKDPYQSLHDLGEKLRQRFKLTNLGLIMTDSHTHPLRRGVTGIGLAHYGFKATQSYVGKSDLFGRPLQMTSINVLDALAVAAVYTMGEADESSPLALILAAGVDFTQDTSAEDIRISLDEDLYGSLLKRKSQ